MDIFEHARGVLDLEIAGLQRVRNSLDVRFEEAVTCIEGRLRKGGKVVATGVGKSYHIAQKIAGTLSSTGTPSAVLDIQQAMHGDMGVLGSHDVLVALSYSGESDELLDLLPIARRRGVAVVSLTGSADSSVAQLSDVVIPVTVDQEACPFNMAPTVSTTATLAMGDALAMVLLSRREFTQDDYAELHPGGAIGRTLLLRVADFMRTEERVARVCSGQTVRDAVLAMTRARSGSAGIVDGDGILIGIFTDGDLRRHIFDGGDVMDRSIEEVMTQDPITLRADERAADVLEVYAEHEIDDLAVVDENKRLIGLIDIQQLPKLKLV